MKKPLLYVFIVSFLILYIQETKTQNPTISNLSLDASPDGNSTNDDLEANYSVGSGVVETASAWYRNGSPLAILYLPFEGGATNALLDFSGNGNNASTTGNTSSTPIWSMTGGHNGAGAFEFDGNDYLYAGSILPLNSSYTKTAWVYDTGSGYRNIISSTLQINNNHSFNVHPDNTLHAGHSFGNAIVSDLDPLDQHTWYFVAVTFDYETGEMALYKDAVQVDREIVPDSLKSVVDPGVLIGAKNNLYAWKGTIDEPCIYDFVLTDAQLRNIYLHGNDEILAGETRIEDEWQVHVTPFSTTQVGTTYPSNTIILESMSVSSPTLAAASPENLTVDDLTVTYTSSASVVETAVAWYNDGTPDALLYFPFEGGPSNALLDFSGNNNHLSRSFDVIRVPRWESNRGHNGTGSFYFNGNDWLEVVDVFPLNSSYTKSAWVNASSFGYNNIMSSRLHGANNHFFKIDPDGTLNAGHSFGSPIVEDPTPLNSPEWYFVAVTFDYASGVMTLYKNGVQVDQATVPESLRSVVDASVQIGSMQTVYGWEGNIDDARLHDRVLSVEQIQALYNIGNHIIVSEETSGGEDWQVRITPLSESELGEQRNSNIITIHSVLVDDIPDQSISEGAIFSDINLDDYLTTYDFVEDDIVWSSTGSSDLIVVIDPDTHIATITIPDGEWSGAEDITFTATNPNLDSGSSEVTFTVVNINDAPELTDIGPQTTDEGTILSGLSVVFSDADPLDTHTITVTSGNSNVTVENISGNTSGSTYDLVPAAEWNGSAQITVTVTDNGTGTLSDSEIYTLTVNAVNDEPILTPVGDQNVDEDNTLAGLAVVFTDADAGDAHAITVVSDEANVTVANLSGNISGSTYDLVPVGNWSGTAQITVTVADDGTGALFDSETYTFTVNPVNDQPVLTDIGAQDIDEDVTLTGLSVVFTDVDPLDTHTITVTSGNSNVTVENISGNTSGSTYDLVPAAEWNGSAQITVTVTDNGTGTLSDSEIYTLTVNAVNDEPVLTTVGDQNVDEDNTLAGLAVVFTDADAGDAHAITVVSDEANVTVANLSGNISGSTYDLVPAANWFGTAQITVTVTDNGTGALSDMDVYTLTVAALNDAPMEINLSSDTVSEMAVVGTIVGLLSSVDPDAGDTHDFQFDTDGGVLDVDNDAFTIVGDTLKTNVELNFEEQSTYSIYIQSDDGQGGTFSQGFTINVNDVLETGVKDIYSNLVFNVYPVPAIEFVMVEIDNPDNKELLLEIYSITGRLVHAEPIWSKNKVDLTGFSDGAYILRIRGEQIYGTRKIIVKDR